MTELRRTQAPGESLTWTYDFTKELAANGSPTIVTSGTTITTDTAGANVTSVTQATPLVTGRLACSSVPLGTMVTMTCHAVLSSGEFVEKIHQIKVEAT
jgi:hypothetical protein